MVKVNKRIEFLTIIDQLKEKLVSQQYIAKQLHVTGAAVSQWLHRKSLPQRNLEVNLWKLKKMLTAINRIEALEKKK